MPSLLKAKGLHTNNNELTVPEGALVEADNVNIDQNDTLTSRRGFKKYGDDFAASTDRAKQLMVYKDRILRHYGSSIQYDSDGSGTFSNFSGSYSELETGLRMKYFELNSNFYFTTNDGIKKISASSASSFTTDSGFIVDSGVAKGLDIQASLDYVSSGFFTADNQIGYRVVWGYNDVNNNLVLGAPSERVTITNEASHSYTSITDNGSGKCRFTDTAHGLEIGDVITVADCSETEYNTTHTVTAIETNTFDTNVDIAELSDAITLANDCRAMYIAHIADGVEHSTADSTNTCGAAAATNYATLITLVTELVSATTSYDAHNQDLIDGVGPVYHDGNVAGATAYDLISTTAPTSLADAITDLNDFKAKYNAHDADAAGHDVGAQHAVTASDAPTITTATDGTWSYTCQVSLTFTIPSDCNSTDYFYQIYRTGLSGAEETDPGDEMFLVYEKNLTDTAITGDIALGYVTLADENYPESFRESAAPLYTNETTGDGILQANDRPPVAKDVAVFRESAFYANTKTLQKLTLTITSVASFVAGTTKIIIGDDTGGTIYNGESAENTGTNSFKIYSSGSASQNIRDTCKSLIHVINRDSGRLVNAYYGSGPDDLPGIINFEAVSLDDTYIDFGVTGTVGSDFNPSLTQAFVISAISTATAPVITTSTDHGLTTGDTVYLYSDTSTPALNDTYTVTVTDTDKFTIVETVTGAGTSGHTFKQSVYTDNEVAPNRLYFSKTSQPEAVPATNWIDIGAKDSAILRIVALRDNLFVLKEDGVYVISGTTAPSFDSRLLDNSINFKAADSAVILNNQIYALTTQGIVTISDSGVGVISRPIEDKILNVTNSRFSNYNIYAFGIAYESDRSYLLWLPTATTDTYATQCYRYNVFNKTWTRWIKNVTCGIVNNNDDKLYLGDGANDFILQERKTNDRSDYADLETSATITQDGVSSTTVQLASITNVDIGDTLVQTQYVTVVRFNRLLNKLDIDPGLTDVNYYSTLYMSTGDSPYTKVSALMTKLTADDSGQTYTYDSPTTFSGLMDTFNGITAKLNASTSDSSFSNYETLSTSVTYESVINNVTNVGNKVTTTIAMPFLQGEVVIHDGYERKIVWSPQHFGDPSIFKQVREASILFDGNTYTDAKIAFASDFSPSFEENSFNGLGPGTFGSIAFGNSIFGGNGTDRGFRDLVPQQKQRCRYITCRFRHLNARENFSIVGISLTMRAYSSRPYRSV